LAFCTSFTEKPLNALVLPNMALLLSRRFAADCRS
jgi:hypothetical protein